MSTPLSVLVVDAHRDGADALAELLTAHGHRVRVAYTAADAETEMRADLPDAVVVAFGRPGDEGFDLVGAFVRLRPRPFIVTLATSRLSRRPGFVGGDYHVLKTDDPDWLVAVLANYAAAALV